MKNILIAPNAFKGSLDAEKAALAIQAGFQESSLKCTCRVLPIADGGDGSLRVIARYLKANLFTANVHGPLGWNTDARYGWNPAAKTAVIELAEASGIHLLNRDQLSPWEATTYGTGQLMVEVIEAGAEVIYLTVGGSATVDGAIGILDALGAVFHHAGGVISQPLAADLEKITDISLDKVRSYLGKTEIRILCDVTNPLLGGEGAARVFAPQKGASENDVIRLESGFENLAHVVKTRFGKDIGSVKHGGAAGGVAAVLHGLLGAKLLPGAETILEWADFDRQLHWADLVVTGEGHIDRQTSYGKAPGIVAKRAKKAKKPVIGLSGFVEAADLIFESFDAVYPITNGPDSLANAMANTEINLKRTAFQVGNLLQIYSNG